MYKLAAVKKKSHEAAARKRVNRQLGGSVLGAATLTGPIPGMVMGYNDGKTVGHPAVGALLGSTAVNGAVAKDSGISTLGTSIGHNAKDYGLLGAGLGAIGGLAGGGMQAGLPGAIGGALAGGVVGGALGAGSGAAGGAIAHGMGHMFGNDQSSRYKHRKHR